MSFNLKFVRIFIVLRMKSYIYWEFKYTYDRKTPLWAGTKPVPVLPGHCTIGDTVGASYDSYLIFVLRNYKNVFLSLIIFFGLKQLDLSPKNFKN